MMILNSGLLFGATMYISAYNYKYCAALEHWFV